MNDPVSADYEAIVREMVSIAGRSGLRLNPGRLEINESGMDFLVAFAAEEDGRMWVLRKPRRSDVWVRAENERNVLRLVGRHLPTAVPDWRICTPDLIAYPMLSGHPVATVDPAGGGYVWRYEQSALSDVFFDSLAGALAALHRIDHGEAAREGIRVKNPQASRQAVADNIEEIRQSFTVPDPLYGRWRSWLTDDAYWPEHSVLNHGDLHPPHIIVDGTQRVTGLIDWTEAEIADPGKDFVIYYALFGKEGLRDLLNRYERAGGRVWPGMMGHIAEQWAAYPALVAKFALTTGRDSDMAMAKGMLEHWQVE